MDQPKQERDNVYRDKASTAHRVWDLRTLLTDKKLIKKSDRGPRRIEKLETKLTQVNGKLDGLINNPKAEGFEVLSLANDPRVQNFRGHLTSAQIKELCQNIALPFLKHKQTFLKDYKRYTLFPINRDQRHNAENKCEEIIKTLELLHSELDIYVKREDITQETFRRYPLKLRQRERSISEAMEPIRKSLREFDTKGYIPEIKYQALLYIKNVIINLNKYKEEFNDYKIKSENDLIDIVNHIKDSSNSIKYIERYIHNIDVYHQMIEKVKKYTENFYNKLENGPDTTRRKKEALEEINDYYSTLEETNKVLHQQERELAHELDKENISIKLINKDSKNEKNVKETIYVKINKKHMNQLKASMSPIFRRGGDIQLLSEETFTFKIMDQTLQYPNLTDKFMQLLQHNVSEAQILDHRSQTALAFSYASEYLSLEKVSRRSSNASPEGSQSKALRPDWAERAMNIIEQKKKQPSVQGSRLSM